MAGLKDADDYKDGEKLKAGGLLKLASLGLGVVCLILFFILAVAMPEKRGEMGYSWLFAVIFFTTLCLGGIFWTLLHHASNSGWGIVVRRLMENLGSVIPVILLLGLPLILVPDFRDNLWEWIPERAKLLKESAEHADEKHIKERIADLDAEVVGAKATLDKVKAEETSQTNPTPGSTQFFKDKLEKVEAKLAVVEAVDRSEGAVEQVLKDEHFQHENVLLYNKRGYLNEPFWYLRFIFYIVTLSLVIFLLRKWSINCDSDGDPKWLRLTRRAACGFLPFMAVAWTFLVFDWLMALDYSWFSTMWGVYLFAGCALNSMALLILLTTWLKKTGHLKIINEEHYHLMGKLMFAFTVFWAYIAFSQFFLIWYANITEETKFYLTRNTEYWNTHAIVFLVVGHFFVPFTIMLVQKFKKMPMVICSVCVWNLVMHMLDIYWIIIPERGPSLTHDKAEMLMVMPGAIWFDILAFLAVAGIFGFCLLRQLGTASLFPCRDPRLDESLNVLN